VAVLVLASRGQWDDATRHLAAAKQMAAFLGDPATTAYADNAAVHVAMCRGDSPQVVVDAGRLAGQTHGAAREPGILAWPVHYAEALVDVGRLDDAAREVGVLEDVARARERCSRLAGLARVRGKLAASRREVGAARGAFEEALELSGQGADALEQARAHEAYGRFLRRRGERRSAIAELEMARERFLSLEAAPFLDRCDTELVACGLSPGPRSRDRAGALTPQERVVARLVCMGRSNREVADELVLSVKTVGYHLSNVYHKLGVHSRTQLATHPDMANR
jgi:DNA-binding CsgD family transcriptional regulator